MANNDSVLIPYVIQEGSFWYVAYKEKNPFVPEITVSAKGIANHMSEEINDGYDFGPDTYNPSVTSGVPLTQTSGLIEAYNYSKSLVPNTVSIHLLGNNIEISEDVNFSLNNSGPGVNIKGISSAKITSSNGSVLYVGSNMNIDEVGFGVPVIVLNTVGNVTFTRNAFLTDVVIVAPATNIQFLEANYFLNSILYTSSVATSITSPGGAIIENLIVKGNTWIHPVAPLNFTSSYGASGVAIEDVLLQNFVFRNNTLQGAFSSSYPPAFILPYVTPNYDIDLHGFSTDTSTSSSSFVSIYGIFTPSGQNYTVLTANPPVSGTVYQNINQYDIEIDLPAYATTSATAGYVTVAKGATSTPTAIGNQYVSGDTSDTSEQIIRLRVPAGWYYEFTSSGVTFGTASVFAE